LRFLGIDGVLVADPSSSSSVFGFIGSSGWLIPVLICSGPFAGMARIPSASHGRELRFTCRELQKREETPPLPNCRPGT
jgi:hypothetical protein